LLNIALEHCARG